MIERLRSEGLELLGLVCAEVSSCELGSRVVAVDVVELTVPGRGRMPNMRSMNRT